MALGTIMGGHVLADAGAASDWPHQIRIGKGFVAGEW
jgi:hypothetical protein